jgi:hypothetical protein
MDQKILQPLLLGPARQGQLQKPLLVIAMTDGAPAGENTDKSEFLLIVYSRGAETQGTGPGGLSIRVENQG